jgi:hypothetical protein
MQIEDTVRRGCTQREGHIFNSVSAKTRESQEEDVYTQGQNIPKRKRRNNRRGVTGK